MVTSCTSGATQAFLGTRSWSKGCACEKGSTDYSKDSSLEALCTDSGASLRQEDVMGASALEKKGRGTKRLRSALVNGNGLEVKKQLNGDDIHVVSGGMAPEEQKEAKLGRSFSDATIASMPLKKRKLQLMKAMMEEEPLAENGHAKEGEAERSPGVNGIVTAEEGLADQGGGLLDVLAGVAADVEIVSSGSPILKAPVKGKRNGGRRARFAGEKGNSSRENSADEAPLQEQGVRATDKEESVDEKQTERLEEVGTAGDGGGSRREEVREHVTDEVQASVLQEPPTLQNDTLEEAVQAGDEREVAADRGPPRLGVLEQVPGVSRTSEVLADIQQDEGDKAAEAELSCLGGGGDKPIRSGNDFATEEVGSLLNSEAAVIERQALEEGSQVVATIRVPAQEWTGAEEITPDGNLSPVSIDEAEEIRRGGVDDQKQEEHAGDVEEERLSRGVEVESGAPAKCIGHEESGAEAQSGGKHEAEAVEEAAVKESSTVIRSNGCEGTDLDGDQVVVDYGGSSGEEDSASPPEAEVLQTSLAAAVSSAVAAAQGGGETLRHKEGGRSEKDELDKAPEVKVGRGSDSRGSDSRSLEDNPPPPARRVIDLRHPGSRESSRERREDADRWQNLDRRHERPLPYRREFSGRGGPRDYHPSWGSAPPYGMAPKWGGPAVRRGAELVPPVMNAAAVAAARLQSTGFVVNPDGTISKVPEPMMGARGGGMYPAGGLRRIGGPGGVPRAVLAYPGMGVRPGMGGLVGPVTRPVMLVPGRGLVEVPYSGPRPMMGGPPPRYPPGWRRGRSPSPPPPARAPPARGGYHAANGTRRGRSRSRSRSPPPPRRDYHSGGLRSFERNGSRGHLDTTPPRPRTRSPPSRRGESLDSPRGVRDSPLASRRGGGSPLDGRRVVSPLKGSPSPVRKRARSASRDSSRSLPLSRRELVELSPSKRRDKEETNGTRDREPPSRKEWARDREGAFTRDWEQGVKDRSSRRYESPPPRRRNGVIGSALTDERDRAMLESVQRG